ncbi:SLATT domain-containing protein [Halobacillus kuroshimensis]|uniref:SLATT domain-containing protein n=1 Tax=Halobacillus kuroshimensis TaxID=302481 RepID=A0ABS3E122_9BACI|nr:SLATT domain-containing protein [Halobacillus kuroshimensis]MBN8237296.1 SLATT domain-containing protein [Halobacillus kuroshimensis]
MPAQQTEESILDKEFNDLKRRMKTTRKARIEASKRLRRKHSYFEKITYFYSLILLVLSVWFLNKTGDSGTFATKFLLILSLTLTYFTMFLNIRNYKERAGEFETNYQHLDVLTNKLDRFKASEEELDVEKLKEFQREYEKLIIGNENHLNIDYFVSTEENQQKFKDKIYLYQIREKFVNGIIAIYPILLLLIIYIFNKLINWLNF